MKIKYGILLSILFSTLKICAQTGYGSGYTNPQVIRNSDTLFYYVNNPDSNNATFTWTITGGIIAGHTSPFTAAGANSIGVIWDDANKQTANNGTLTVSKAIDYGYGTSCFGPEQMVNIESWVRPKAIVTTPDYQLCAGEASVIDVVFEGKADYLYKWNVYEKDNPTNIIQADSAKKDEEGVADTLTGDLNINPATSEGNRFIMQTPSGQIDIDTLEINGGGYTYTGPASEINLKVKAQGRTLTINGENIILDVNTLYTITSANEDMMVNLRNTNGNNNGHWWISVSGEDVIITPDPGIISSDTNSFLTSSDYSITIDIAGIDNTSGSDKIYVFEITKVKDAFADDNTGDLSEAAVEITVHSALDIGSDTIEICENESRLLTVEAGYARYLWNTISGTNEFEVREQGTIILEVENNFGCWQTDSVIIIVHKAPMLELGNDTVLCRNNNLTLNAGYHENYMYQWNTGENSQEITVSETGTYKVKVTNEFLCSGLDSVNVRILDMPDPVPFIYPAQIKGSTPLMVDFSTNINVTDICWSIDNDKPDCAPTINHTFINENTDVVLSVVEMSYTDQYGCAQSLTDTVWVYPEIISNFIPEYEGCAPLQVVFNNQSQGATSYLWDFGNGDSSEEQNPRYVFEYPGVYEVSLSARNGFGEDLSTKQLIVNEGPRALFEIHTPEVEVSDQVSIQNLSENAVTYLWEFGNGETSDNFEPTYSYSNTGAYDITLFTWSETGCADTLVMESGVLVRKECDLIFPNAFTPDKSGPGGGQYDPEQTEVTNDIFHPLYRNIAEYELSIFNRYGEIMFKTNNINVGWDGYYRNNLAIQDTYIYVVKAKCNSGKDISWVGTVTLIQ